MPTTVPKRQPSYNTYINSKAWKLKRMEILRRDGRKCVRCGSKRRLQIHHKTYVRFGNEDDADLETLCEHCHREGHGMKPLAFRKRKRQPDTYRPDDPREMTPELRQKLDEWNHGQQSREEAHSIASRIFFVTEGET
jgi:HNH endonuclease